MWVQKLGVFFFVMIFSLHEYDSGYEFVPYSYNSDICLTFVFYYTFPSYMMTELIT